MHIQANGLCVLASMELLEEKTQFGKTSRNIGLGDALCAFDKSQPVWRQRANSKWVINNMYMGRERLAVTKTDGNFTGNWSWPEQIWHGFKAARLICLGFLPFNMLYGIFCNGTYVLRGLDNLVIPRY